jgi:subtilisin family serine protease
MNNLKKNMVLLFIVIMTMGMVMVPFTPTTQVNPQVATPQVATPEQVKMDLQKYLVDRGEQGPLDSVLASYRDTGIIASDVVKSNDGAVGILITLDKSANLDGLDSIVRVNWKVDFGVATIASAYVSGIENLVALENYNGVVAAFADRLYKGGFDDFNTVIDKLPVNNEPDMYANVPTIGADAVWNDFAVDGAGIRVATIDTGVDFSHPDLMDAMDIGSDGLPTSYDPTGWGFVNTLYRVNMTYVANTTAWFQYSSWNMLSYMKAGHYYVNWSTCQHGSPYVNNQGGLSNLDFWFDGYLDAWYDNVYLNKANLTDFYDNVIKQDYEIPTPAQASGSPQLNYSVKVGSAYKYVATTKVPYITVGYAFQQRNDPYVKVFAPVMTLNGTITIVDWNTTRAQTEWWMDAFRWPLYYAHPEDAQVDFNVTANWDYYGDLGDWSFVDDLAKGKYYTADGNKEHLIMYNVYPEDGMRFGLGTFAHVWDGIFYGTVIDGMVSNGRGVGIMYDGDSHGTFVSGEIAGRGVQSYPVGLNGAPESLKGVAPGSTICGISTVGMVSEFNSFLYAAGFDFDGDYWVWNNESVHQMNITSNSWGWVAPQYYELWGLYSLVYSAMATPGFFDAQYPGMVQCFSAGNSGPGYGTGGPPCVPQIITVGATTSYHTFDNSYGPGQGYDQIADFSSRGPMTLGYAKPDVVAPGRNTWGIVPDYGAWFDYFYQYVYGTRDDYANYAGTSMACPMAAGLAALMLDANPNLTPDEVKTIMMSTAKDLGLDGLTQGAGRIDAFAAVDYILNGHGYLFTTMDSSYNWANAVGDAWAYDMYSYKRGALINNSAIALGHAPYFKDYSLYFGIVEASDSVTMTIDTDSNWNYGTFTWSAKQYVAGPTYTFPFETYIFNETTSDYPNNVTRGGWINLATELGPTDYSALLTYNYATISITGDQDALGTWYSSSGTAYDDLWAFVFDWSDTSPTNSRPDYYNGTLGDELTRLTYAGGTGNVLKMDLSSPSGLSALFPNAGIILVNDDTIMQWPYTGGNNLQVTIQTWVLADDTNIVGFADASPGTDVSLTVAPGTDYGIHQGFIIADNTTHQWKMPYTYNVYPTYAANDTILTVASGYGDVQTPYEHGALTAGWDSYYESSSGDHLAFLVNVTDSDVNYLAARLEWTNVKTDMDIDIVDMTGFDLASSADSVKDTDTTALAMTFINGTTGMYMFYTTMNLMDGTTIPENFTLQVIGLHSIEEPTLTLRWSARDVPTQTVITAGGSAIGDHVYMNATWNNGVNPLIPEFGITSMQMKILYGTLVVRTGPTHPAVNPDAVYGGGVIDSSEFAWETVGGIKTDDVVRLSCDFDGSDIDVILWWSDVPMAQRTYGNRIVTDPSMASSAHPEAGSFTATQDGSIDVGIMDYAGDSSTYTLTVDTRVGLEPARAYNTKTFQIDTYYLLQNQTFSVLVDSDTGSNYDYAVETDNIFIGNYFKPHITVNAPSTISTNHFNLTWSCTDRNANDTNYYSVWLSNDGGASYMLLQQNTTNTWYMWNAHGWLDTNYMVRVRAYSLDFLTYQLVDTDGKASTPPVPVYYNSVANPPASYWPGDFSDGFSASFAAGDVPIPTPPPTTTTTTTTTAVVVTPIDPLLIGLVGGIGIGVVIILILFLIRKK